MIMSFHKPFKPVCAETKTDDLFLIPRQAFSRPLFHIQDVKGDSEVWKADLFCHIIPSLFT